MTSIATWLPYDEGRTIGTVGVEGGIVLIDEQYDGFSRITLEKDAHGVPFTIVCGVYGWFLHTVYAGVEEKARATYEDMKKGLAHIVDVIPSEENLERDKSIPIDAIEDFVKRFET